MKLTFAKLFALLVIGVPLAILVAKFLTTGKLPAMEVAPAPVAPTPVVGGASIGYGTTVRVSGLAKYNGSSAAINGELWSSNDQQYAAETSIPSALTSISTSAPNTFDGYIMLGNDNFESTSDRGLDYYYKKYPAAWPIAGTVTFTNVPVYEESNIAWTIYKDGTAGTVNTTGGLGANCGGNPSISVGSGATVTSTELKIASASDKCIGNPEIKNPLAICFNATSASYAGDWDEIRPVKYVEAITPPGFLSGLSMIGKCYVLPTEALCDFDEYRFYIILDAKSGTDPSATNNNVTAILLDKAYSKNDKLVWTLGWGDESDQAADTDVGMSALGANGIPACIGVE